MAVSPATPTQTNPYKPDELIVIHQPLGLVDLGSQFNASAPFKACRLCGALYQSTLDLEEYEVWKRNDGFPGDIRGWNLDEYVLFKRLQLNAKDRRFRWHYQHKRRKHANDASYGAAVQELQRTGAAFTPEAAFALVPYGIAPTGNKSAEVIHAMATAPRAPLNDPEG